MIIVDRVPHLERERDDIVHVKRIGHGHEVASADRDDERFIPASLVDVVQKTELLERLQNECGVAHPVSIPTNRFLASDAFDRFHAVGDEALFRVTTELVAALPGASVSGGFMATAHNLS